MWCGEVRCGVVRCVVPRNNNRNKLAAASVLQAAKLVGQQSTKTLKNRQHSITISKNKLEAVAVSAALQAVKPN